MERKLTWYLLLLKRQLKKPAFYLEMFFLILLLFFVSQLRFLDGQNMKIGLLKGNSIAGNEMTELLLSDKSRFEFTLYEDEDTMKDEVYRGELECAFAFHDDLDEKMKMQDIKDTVSFYYSQFSTKSLTAREKIFSAFYQINGMKLMKTEEDEIFEVDSEESRTELTELLDESYQKYVNGKNVFRVIFQSAKKQMGIENKYEQTDRNNQSGSDNQTEQNSQTNSNNQSGQNDQMDCGIEERDPLRALSAILLFMIIWMASAEKDSCACVQKMRGGGFEICRILAAVTIPAVICFAFLLYSEGTGNIGKELVLFLFLLVWSMAISSLFTRRKRKHSLGLVYGLLFFIQIGILPVFWNLQESFPVLYYIGNVFPPGLYLNLAKMWIG